MHCRDIADPLFLLVSELLYAAPHDGEIARNNLKLLHRLRRSCGCGGRWCGGDFVSETDDNQPDDGPQVLTISIASSPWDCHADDPDQSRDAGEQGRVMFARQSTT